MQVQTLLSAVLDPKLNGNVAERLKWVCVVSTKFSLKCLVSRIAR